VLIALLPCTNPDGMTMVADWFARRKKAGKPNAPLPRLYQKWAGHDNNRDWFMLNLPETRVITKQLYERIRPTRPPRHAPDGRLGGPRFFVPALRGPDQPQPRPDPDAGPQSPGHAHGARHDAQRLQAASSRARSFDNWWNGGNRNVPFRHNILGILTECASANLGDPVSSGPQDVCAAAASACPSTSR
jgi:hypothetical protein